MQFADRNDIDASIFQMFQKAMADTPLFRNKQLFFKYAMTLYLSGCRRVEPFLKPVSFTSIHQEGATFLKIVHQNAKHFQSAKITCSECNCILESVRRMHLHQEQTAHRKFTHLGSRKTISSPFLLFNPYENAMSRYILQDKLTATIDFTPLLPQRIQEAIANGQATTQMLEIAVTGITKKFRMFKVTKITDGTTTFENTNIVPHMLRHMRAYDLAVVHSVPMNLVERLLGWSSVDMTRRYVDIQLAINDREIFSMWRNAGADLHAFKTLMEHPVEQQ